MSTPPTAPVQGLQPGTVSARDRLARRPAPFIWQEAARRMAERLPLLKLQPQSVFDMGCAWGDGLALLRQQYARAQIVGVEPSALLADAARKAHACRNWLRGLRGQGRTEVIAAPLSGPIGAQTVFPAAQMLWSNLALPWVAELDAMFAAWHRALLPDGVLMFTTFGPDTLRELRRAECRDLGVIPPTYPDMHDLGDMLVHQGFAEPVMDMEMLHLRYASPKDALAELAELGRPVHAAVAHGLRTPRQWQALQHALLNQAQAAGRTEVGLSFELVYGHAFKPATQPARAGVASFPLEQLRATGRKR
ncbi:MAG: methyltransferase domain-containing protein [Thiomonas sp.]